MNRLRTVNEPSTITPFTHTQTWTVFVKDLTRSPTPSLSVFFHLCSVFFFFFIASKEAQKPSTAFAQIQVVSLTSAKATRVRAFRL